MSKVSVLSQDRRVVVLFVCLILMAAWPAMAAHYVSYDYLVFAYGAGNDPIAEADIMLNTDYFEITQAQSGGNQNHASIDITASLATGRMTVLANAVGYQENSSTSWTSTGRVELIEIKDDITFTVPAGTYHDGVEVRLHGWVQGWIASDVGGSAQTMSYISLNTEMFQTGLRTVGVLETGTIPFTHFFVLRKQLVAPGQALVNETEYVRDVRATIHRAWTATVSANAGDGWVTGYGNIDFSDGVQLTTLWTPPGVTWTSSSGVFLDQVPATVISGPPAAPAVLGQNCPNPFNPLTVIPFELKQASTVDLEVFDLAGHRVRMLHAGVYLDAGPHEATWNGRDDHGLLAPSGRYFYRLSAVGIQISRPMTLIR